MSGALPARLKRVPGWLLFLAAALFWFFVVEMGSFAYLWALRGNENHPISYLLHGMVDKFHPLFRKHGHFSASNYYPYIGAYYEGDWSKTKPPAKLHPDGWVLPHGRTGDGEQLYYTMDKPAGTIRVITLGGSTMAGMGQSGPENSIPSVLERLLRKTYPEKKIEVLNGAFYTHTAAQELMTLSTKLIAYHPDLVLVLDGYNELVRVYHFPDMPPFWAVPHEQMYRTYSRVQTFKGAAAQLGFLLSKRFYCLAILRAIRYNRRFIPAAAKTPDKPLDPAPFNRAVSEYISLQKSLLGVAKTHGVPIILAAQPNLGYHKRRSTEEEGILAKWEESKPKHTEAVAAFYPELQKRYTEFRKAHAGKDVRILDLIDLFQENGDTIYVDSCHYNDKGAELIAKALFPQAAAALGLPPRKP